MKIVNKISLSFLIAAIIVISIAMPVFYSLAKNNLEEVIFNCLEEIAQSRVMHIETFLDKYRSEIEILANSFLMKRTLQAIIENGPDAAGLSQELGLKLDRILEIRKDCYGIFILDTNGKIIISADGNNIGLDKSTDAYFLGGRKGTYIKDAYYSEATGKESIAVSAPVLDEENKKLLGVLVEKIDLTGLNRIVTDRTGLGETGEIYLVNKYGFMITPSRFMENTFLKQKVISKNFRDCCPASLFPPEDNEHLAVGVFPDYRGKMVLGTHKYIPEMQWCLLAEIDQREALAPLFKIKVLFLVIMVSVPVIILVIGIFVSKLITKPLYRLHQGIEIIGQGNLDYKVGTKAKDEVGQLSRTFDKMTADLKRTTTSITELKEQINEREKAEALLQKSENKYRTLLENLPQKIFLKDRNSVYISCNENYARDLKISPQEISGKTDFEFYPKELAEKYRRDDKRLMDSGKTEDIEEKYIQEGKELIVHTVKTPVKNEQGDIYGILGIFWDITAHKEAEEKVRQAAEEWRKTFDSISDLVFIQDTNYIILKVNLAFASLVKMKPEEIIGKKCHELLHKAPEPWPNCPFKLAKEDGQSHIEEVDDPAIGIPLLVSASPIYNEAGKMTACIHVAKDITKLKQTEKKLEEQNKELQKLDQLKSEFVSMVSHELRTPLSITKEGISLVLDEIPGKLNEKQTKLLVTSKKNIDRLARIINDLLDISKIEAGRLELKKETFDITEVVQEITSSFKSKIKKRNLQLLTDLPPHKVTLIANKDKIIQVFTNLVANSLRFTDRGYIKLVVEEQKDKITCSVIDTGKGFTKETLPRIFDKFQQFDREAGPGEKGTGLGLSICKGIVELHKGNIWAESTLGEGTKFSFTLPKNP